MIYYIDTRSLHSLRSLYLLLSVIMPSEKPKQTRTAISFDIKKEICEYMTVNLTVNQSDVAVFFNTKYQKLNINRTTINKIWKSREKWLAILPSSQTSQIFCYHPVQFPDLDKAMQI